MFWYRQGREYFAQFFHVPIILSRTYCHVCFKPSRQFALQAQG